MLPRLLIQTPRSYLSAAQFSVAFVGLSLLAGIGVQTTKAHWSATWRAWDEFIDGYTAVRTPPWVPPHR